jgi:hypothetical protein
MNAGERKAILKALEEWGTNIPREDLEGNSINLAKLAFIAGWEAGRKYEKENSMHTLINWITLINCEYCDGDYEVEIEEPDYDVGLTGHSVFINTAVTNTHDPNCPVLSMSPEEINRIEERLSITYEPDFDPY